MEKRMAYLGVGLISLIGAAANALDGYQQRPTGRWSFVLGPLFDAFGSHGITALWLAMGAFFLFVAWFDDRP